MEGHNQWIKPGFYDGVFLFVGNLQPGLGGSVIAYNTSLVELQSSLNEDPFVERNVVTAEILKIESKKQMNVYNFF